MTGALTLDVDSAGTSNYILLVTDVASNNAAGFCWTLYDFATSSQQNDRSCSIMMDRTITVAFQADSVTRVIDFAQTPTVGGTAVSLVGHTHDDRYFTRERKRCKICGVE